MYATHIKYCEDCGEQVLHLQTGSKYRQIYPRTCRKCGAEWAFDIYGATCHTMRVTHSHALSPPDGTCS